jgi:hypothetical protein
MLQAEKTTPPYGLTNEEVKKRVGNYALYLQAAKDHVELVENYNYREIATEEDKKKYLAGFEKYTPNTGGSLKKEEDMKLKYITENKLIKKTIFLMYIFGRARENALFFFGGVKTAFPLIVISAAVYLPSMQKTLYVFLPVMKGIILP